MKLYASDLENPPLLIVSDMRRIALHTNWTGMVQESHVLELEDLADVRLRQKLKWAFDEVNVEQLKPKRSANATTEEVAEKFVAIAQNLRARGEDAEKVAHFVNRMVFCMFAEDVDLLPKRMFQRMLEASLADPKSFVANAEGLFKAMAFKGGRVGFDAIDWFNGGLFEDGDALPLTEADIRIALEGARANWSEINPSIMGTLFERGLDPGKRSQLGAHYTDAEKIMLIVRPVIIEPLLREWAEARTEIDAKLIQSKKAKSPAARTKAFNEAQALRIAFIERLKNFRVLDPACGSGNFLFLALKALKDIEFRVNFEAEELGLPPAFPTVGPECVKGIEINPFAAELARVSVWIGEIQWMRENNFGVSKDPILKSLQTIECRDALLKPDGAEAEWPEADAIVGNPPFLGGKVMRNGRPATKDRPALAGLGDAIVDQIFQVFAGRVPAEADLVCYWFTKAREQIENGKTVRAGLVSTNSIRGGANREVLDDIAETGRIFEAWSDEPWVVDGAAVRVSLVCFDAEDEREALHLNGNEARQINPDLTATETDLTKASRLKTNLGVAFMGDTKGGAFDVPGDTARQWLLLPRNPNGRTNSDVLKPWINGLDITRRPAGKWIVDFGWTMGDAEAAMFEAPFQHVVDHVKAKRALNNREMYARYWWRHVEPRQGLWAALGARQRFIVTPTVSKHRVFAWCPAPVCPDHQLIVTARDDDTTFGILHSRMHELWSLGLGTWLGVGNDPRYTPSTTFETFPFPEGLTPNIPAADYATDPRAIVIAKAAARLNDLRENWLNPPDLVKCVPEVVPGYPDRILPADDTAAKALKDRTLTKLYNERPAWLDNAHRDLDTAVAAAYGWPADLSNDEILERLFALNQQRAARQK
ncbi:MAG: class I SAM-dependent DNA methyltransferase [Hyphomicrobium sp.]